MRYGKLFLSNGENRMEFSEVLEKRYSCRAFSDKPIAREDLVSVMKAGTLAPSACNTQPWHFICVDDEEKLARVAKCTQKGGLGFINRFTPQAKAFIVIVKEKPSFSEKVAKVMSSRDYSPYDIGLAGANMVLKATDLGIGSCILGWYDEDKVKEELNIEKSKSVDLIIALGYPESLDAPTRKRKDFDTVHSFNSYGEK